ncbi:hypothetical protein B0H17DRAFT_1177518 [Mycena rosella]|uniref:WD40 repeat-like protein n=1 Tax=Mycena rosella TaxID=1033263 RepID=A0AAD7DS59_MYCRO|nr:hypothetical protein B0H17DRAFT_1177518 [Mycena rosella]
MALARGTEDHVYIRKDSAARNGRLSRLPPVGTIGNSLQEIEAEICKIEQLDGPKYSWMFRYVKNWEENSISAPGDTCLIPYRFAAALLYRWQEHQASIKIQDGHCDVNSQFIRLRKLVVADELLSRGPHRRRQRHIEACIILEGDVSQFSQERPEASIGDHRGNRIVNILEQACHLLRDIHPKDPQFHDIVERVNRTINLGIEVEYRGRYQGYSGEEGVCEYALSFSRSALPSFAHSRECPSVENVSAEFADASSAQATRAPNESTVPDPWFTTPRPHNLSSLLSRFGWDLPEPSHSSPLVNAIMQARCEISSDPSWLPTGISISASCLLVACKGGWRNDTSSLAYYHDLDERSAVCLFPLNKRTADYGPGSDRYDPFWTAAIDEVNKLMFVAENARARSFAWASPTGEKYEAGLPRHTLNTSDHRGPLSVFAPGRVLRAGRGSIAFWNLDDLETHGPDGKRVVGETDAYYGEKWSSGSDPTSVIHLADPAFAPLAWCTHPNLPGNMLCAPGLEAPPRDYACVSVDLDLAKLAARYLGHGAAIRVLSTSEPEPQAFLTAADDGYVRLYDTRRLLPALTLRAEGCRAAVLVQPDGIPLVFTGSKTEQAVSLWDIRAAKAVYELSTGNNGVSGMAWDAGRSVLYVATVCGYKDRNGQQTVGYRAAQFPEGMYPGDQMDNGWEGDGEGGRSGDEARSADEDGPRAAVDVDVACCVEDLFDDDDGRFEDYGGDYDAPDFAWPRKAAHKEDYFGKVFDAGDHQIFRYAFADKADPSVLPAYGSASPDDDYY